MKFARHLAEEGSEPELHSLYKQLKKSLRIFEGPADAGSVVDVPRTLPSSDDEAEEPHAVAPAGAAAAEPAGASGAAQPSAQQRGGAPAEQQAPGQQQQRQPPAEHEAQFVALVEQCVQQLNEDYLAREETLVIKADIAQQACAAAHSREQQLEAYSSVVNVHGELVLLCHWSMCAYTGIVKILKKHHKRTGQRVESALLGNLMSQPFCSLEEVRGLVRQAEQQMAALAGALGLPPSRSPTAGAAAAAAMRDPAAEVQQLQQPAAAAIGRDSPAVGDSGAAALQAPAADAPPSAAVSMERGQSPEQAQHSAQAARPPLPQGAAAAAAAAGAGPVAQVDVVAASGASDGDRPALKRDRSKVYAPVAKRQERELKGAAGPQPASSGSSMQVSRNEGVQGAADDSASSGQRRTIMQRTKAALQLWKALRTNVSTPSTVAVQPPCLQQPQERQQ